MRLKSTDALDHFYSMLELIRTRGTSSITPQSIAQWNLKEVADGTMIGTGPFSNGTAFHLAIGPCEDGTSHPTKYGAHVTNPDGKKLVWFDWNEQSDLKHRNPHVQFSDNPKKRYNILDQNSWMKICDKLQQLKNTYHSLQDNETEQI